MYGHDPIIWHGIGLCVDDAFARCGSPAAHYRIVKPPASCTTAAAKMQYAQTLLRRRDPRITGQFAGAIFLGEFQFQEQWVFFGGKPPKVR